MTDFTKWIDTVIEEKQIDVEDFFVIGNNIIEYGYVIDMIKLTSEQEQKDIKTMLIKIDFLNGDVKAYLRHLAAALAT